MSALNNSALIGASGSTGYQISRSVRLRSSASAYFNRTFGAGSAVTVYTFSAWVKRGELGTIKPIVQGYLNNNNYGHIIFKADNTIEWREVSVAANYGQVNTNAVFRDPSAWYHIVVVRNGTSLLIYVNGVSQTLTVSTAVNAAGGYLFGASTAQRIGSDQVNSAFFDGYLTEVNFIDGQALTPSSFGETNPVTGVWQPIKYTGTYGTNGFYLNFSDNSGVTATTIGKDYSGNGNNWTPNNISVTAGSTYDSMLDVPTQWADGGNGRGNYCTWSPIDRPDPSPNSYTLTLSNGNLNTATGGAEGFVNNTTLATFQIPTTGKWYWEILVTNVATAASTRSAIGIMNQAAKFADGSDFTYATVAGVYSYSANGQKATSPNLTLANYGNSYTNNDVIGVAVDSDAGKIWFAKNGTWQNSGSPTGGTNEAFSGLVMTQGFQPAIGYWLGCTANFGQQPFAYTPPSGFKALNTLNLPTPTILKGNQYFDATTYTGNGSTQSIVNSGAMQPDFLWVKSRSLTTANWLVNAVTGAGNGLISNSTAAEQSLGIVTSLDSSGFSVSTIGGTNSTTNGNAATFVGWQWKEGATQGFDIVTYTGTGSATTVAHSLGVAPAMIIAKGRGGTSTSWWVYHKSLGTPVLEMNSTAASATYVSVFNNTAPTSSVFSVGTGDTNRSGQTQLAYLFAEVAGFSKFGSYTGNGSADGPFVFTDFRPRYVLIKCSSAAGTGWYVYDTVRNTYNVMDLYLRPDVSDAETTFTTLDCLSNGFKLRTTNSQFNGSGSTYIFAAFAENPFKNALAR